MTSLKVFFLYGAHKIQNYSFELYSLISWAKASFRRMHYHYYLLTMMNRNHVNSFSAHAATYLSWISWTRHLTCAVCEPFMRGHQITALGTMAFIMVLKSHIHRPFLSTKCFTMCQIHHRRLRSSISKNWIWWFICVTTNISGFCKRKRSKNQSQLHKLIRRIHVLSLKSNRDLLVFWLSPPSRMHHSLDCRGKRHIYLHIYYEKKKKVK